MNAPKIAFVTFARGSDSRLVDLSDSILFDHFPDALRFVIDEQDSKVTLCDKRSRISTIEFSRGDTLDGKECVVGMFRTFQEIAIETGCDYVFKLDADVLMLRTGFVDALRFGGFVSYGKGIDLQVNRTNGQTSVVPYCQGAAYAIASKALQAFPQNADALETLLIDADIDCGRTLSTKRKAGYIFPEDESISRLLRNHFRNIRLFGWNHQDANFGHLGSWDYARMGESFNPEYANRLRCFDFVEFGQTSPLATLYGVGDFEARRNITERNMERAAEMVSRARPNRSSS